MTKKRNTQLDQKIEEKIWNKCKFSPPEGSVYRHFLSDGEEFIHQGKMYVIRVKEKKEKNKTKKV